MSQHCRLRARGLRSRRLCGCCSQPRGAPRQRRRARTSAGDAPVQCAAYAPTPVNDERLSTKGRRPRTERTASAVALHSLREYRLCESYCAQGRQAAGGRQAGGAHTPRLLGRAPPPPPPPPPPHLSRAVQVRGQHRHALETQLQAHQAVADLIGRRQHQFLCEVGGGAKGGVGGAVGGATLCTQGGASRHLRVIQARGLTAIQLAHPGRVVAQLGAGGHPAADAGGWAHEGARSKPPGGPRPSALTWRAWRTHPCAAHRHRLCKSCTGGRGWGRSRTGGRRLGVLHPTFAPGGPALALADLVHVNPDAVPRHKFMVRGQLSMEKFSSLLAHKVGEVARPGPHLRAGGRATRPGQGCNGLQACPALPAAAACGGGALTQPK